jgi:hypothetical protein
MITASAVDAIPRTNITANSLFIVLSPSMPEILHVQESKLQAYFTIIRQPLPLVLRPPYALLHESMLADTGATCKIRKAASQTTCLFAHQSVGLG